MKNLKDANIKKGTRALLRVDFNVPLSGKQIMDDFRVRAVVPTIQHLTGKGAKVLVMSHLGRPKGKRDMSLSLDPVCQHLSKLLNKEVLFFENIKEAEEGVKNMEPGQVACLQNLRYWKGEKKASKRFAKKLKNLGDIYINDAFAVSHREHASVYVLPGLMPSYGGLLLVKEMEMLDRVRRAEKKPLVFVVGGAKVETKLKTIVSMINELDHVCIGGLIANTILAHKGISIGKSRYEKGMDKYLNKLIVTDTKIHLPVDVVVSTDDSGSKPAVRKAVGAIKENEIILDIGPETLNLFENILQEAAMVVWNGPLGLFEINAFAHGTNSLARSLRDLKAEIIVGGGDIMEAIKHSGAQENIDHASTGGGAMLEYIAEGTLPAIEVLR